MKKRRKTTPRERALVAVVRMMICIIDEDDRCRDCWREADDDKQHDANCIQVQMRRALRVR